MDNSNLLNKMREKVFNRLSSKQSLIRTIIYFIIAIIIVLITSYMLNKISLNDESCNKMNKTLKGEHHKPSNLGSKFDENETYTSGEAETIGVPANCVTSGCYWNNKPVMLRNYNIKSSYNSCCANLYKNGWVSECALREVIAQGCRFLDFEVYSYKGKPVVGVSTKVNDYYMKECYNYIPIGNVFDTINKRAFHASDNCAFANEQPLIINLRFKTNNKDVLDDVAKSFKNSLNSYLLDENKSIYIYSGIEYDGTTGHDNFGTIQMDTIKGKVILFTDLTDDILKSTTKLKKYVNMSSESEEHPYLKHVRYSEIRDLSSADDNWKNNMIICLPDLSNMCQPMDYNKVNGTTNTDVDLGIQIFANCFQSESDELKAYIAYFNDKKSAFVKQTQ